MKSVQTPASARQMILVPIFTVVGWILIAVVFLVGLFIMAPTAANYFGANAKADASILYLTYTELFNVSRDVARRISVGKLHVIDVPAYVGERTILGARTYTAGSFSGSVAIVELAVNVRDASIFGFFEPVLGRTMSVRVEMLREPTPNPCRTC